MYLKYTRISGITLCNNINIQYVSIFSIYILMKIQ